MPPSRPVNGSTSRSPVGKQIFSTAVGTYVAESTSRSAEFSHEAWRRTAPGCPATLACPTEFRAHLSRVVAGKVVDGEGQDFGAVVGADTERRSQPRDEFSDELALEIPPSVKTVVNKCSRESAPAGCGTASAPESCWLS